MPTRCANGLPDFTPSEIFTKEEAYKAIESSKIIIKEIRKMLTS